MAYPGGNFAAYESPLFFQMGAVPSWPGEAGTLVAAACFRSVAQPLLLAGLLFAFVHKCIAAALLFNSVFLLNQSSR